MNRRQFLCALIASCVPMLLKREAEATKAITFTDTMHAEHWATNRVTHGTVWFVGGDPRCRRVRSNTGTVVTLDMTGSARLHKADAKCRRAGRVRERFGLKPRERAQLEHMNCQKIDGEWRTTMSAQAD